MMMMMMVALFVHKFEKYTRNKMFTKTKQHMLNVNETFICPALYPRVAATIRCCQLTEENQGEKEFSYILESAGGVKMFQRLTLHLRIYLSLHDWQMRLPLPRTTDPQQTTPTGALPLDPMHSLKAPVALAHSKYATDRVCSSTVF